MHGVRSINRVSCLLAAVLTASLISGCTSAPTSSNKTEASSGNAESVIIISKEYSASSGVFRVDADYYGESEPKQTDLVLSSLQSFRFDSKKDGNHWAVSWYGFYFDLNDLKNLQVIDLNGNPVAESKADPKDSISDKQFESEVNGKRVSVDLTSYSVDISPEDGYRGEGEFLDLTAKLNNGREYYICTLPMLDDRKPSEKKDSSVVQNAGDLPSLGDGLCAGESGDDRVSYVFNKNISRKTIDSIESIKISEAKIESTSSDK